MRRRTATCVKRRVVGELDVGAAYRLWAATYGPENAVSTLERAAV
jgi:hypothetical protein